MRHTTSTCFLHCHFILQNWPTNVIFHRVNWSQSRRGDTEFTSRTILYYFDTCVIHWHLVGFRIKKHCKHQTILRKNAIGIDEYRETYDDALVISLRVRLITRRFYRVESILRTVQSSSRGRHRRLLWNRSFNYVSCLERDRDQHVLTHTVSRGELNRSRFFTRAKDRGSRSLRSRDYAFRNVERLITCRDVYLYSYWEIDKFND